MFGFELVNNSTVRIFSYTTKHENSNIEITELDNRNIEIAEFENTKIEIYRVVPCNCTKHSYIISPIT